jgi:hypothetical protein
MRVAYDLQNMEYSVPFCYKKVAHQVLVQSQLYIEGYATCHCSKARDG